MTSRRDFLQIAAATAALVPSGWTRAFAQQRLTQDDLLAFEPMGNVTLVHLTDIHAQLRPVLFREPSTNLGVGEARGQVPHITGRATLDLYGIPGGSRLAHALTPEDYVALARSYGRMGGLDRIATMLDAIRAERGDKVLFLDGGDTWQNSYTSMLSKGQDMVDCMALLKPDAMTGHWEFTLGTDRVKEIVDGLGCPFLGQNVRDAEWNEPAFESTKMFERGGAKVAVIGQAFPYTPIANPRWMIPNWSFGIREEDVQASVDKARKEGADLIVLLSHNGFDVDRKLASRVKGIDVVLTGHTHDALPQAVKVGRTLLIASGSHGKFLTRVDLDVRDGAVKGFRSKLIPIFSDVIAPQAAMAARIQAIRAPHEAMLGKELGQTESLLYRRGNFNGTLDDMICDALLSERDAEIALSPGFRWGTTLLPGQPITREDIYNATAITYPAAYRMTMTGARLKEVLEDVADNLFNEDPYYQQGGDMVRVGGVSYAIDIARPAGQRISDLTLLRTGKQIEAGASYTVAGWASVNEGTEGPPIWDVVAAHVQRKGTVSPTPAQVTVRGA
ncbi:thiosulfohydrolase SoxB [Methylorubrum sp. B1-46]|uniref:thiosulfohydrolase SoxB n=1 Tax=Methylorubrum sp. B1-46 TaxID=2897334 RepID=UPI0007C8842B|nr:thiosulfohydrolase SoxB [Methylorubrum sp. B1-46]OAH31502.1 bifunctional metallophosphatase/5'-nucleotidase [Methylorubrum populi]UGB26167.1 thiosulfohydrolase SoxB [Methylorubrum sp. B1-46]